MTLLSTFGSEIEAQALASRLKESGIDHKVEQQEGESESNVYVFDDDLDEAQEIIESQALEDDDDLSDLDIDEIDPPNY